MFCGVRVAIELTALELDRGGTARTIEQLLPALERDERVDLTRIRQHGAVPGSVAGRLARGLYRETVYLKHQLPRRLAQGDLDLIHCPAPLGPGRSRIPMVMTIHDTIAWDHPEWLGRLNVLQLKTVLPSVLRACGAVLTSSEYSRRRLLDRLGLSADAVTVVPLGIDHELFTPGQANAGLLAGLGVKDPFVLTVGTLQPRKNLEAALEAFERIGERAGGHVLAIAGARGWRDDDLLDRIRRSPVADRVLLLGRVSDEELVALYRAATCFVFPSRYEGFGFPPLEAMACGTPVVSSTRTSLAEVVGDAAVDIDPDDPSTIADALLEVLGSEDLRQDLQGKGLAWAGRFTWAECARQTVDVYERVLAQ